MFLFSKLMITKIFFIKKFVKDYLLKQRRGIDVKQTATQRYKINTSTYFFQHYRQVFLSSEYVKRLNAPSLLTIVNFEKKQKTITDMPSKPIKQFMIYNQHIYIRRETFYSDLNPPPFNVNQWKTKRHISERNIKIRTEKNLTL